MSDETTYSRAIGLSIPHESAIQHICGSARFVDDLPEPADTVHLAMGQSALAHARIIEMDLEPVRAAPGVIAVFTADDIPGKNDVSAYAGDEPLFAEHLVTHVGQSLFVVAARSVRAARQAATLARITYETREAVLTIEQALEKGLLIEPTQRIVRGDPDAALGAAPHRLTGQLLTGGQDHFYLEGQVALAVPGEGAVMTIHSSTQHPGGIQKTVAAVLGRSRADILVETRRIGGGFGGKETQAAQFASAAALVAAKLGRPAKLRLNRETDMVMTGKRHDFRISYDVGYDDRGKILGLAITLASRCGDAVDLSPAINDRAMLHTDNCYRLTDLKLVSHRLKTHTVSNTAFRGFGAPQAVLAIERVMDHVAHALGFDPLDVRRENLYAVAGDVTHYGMPIVDNCAAALIDSLAEDTRYRERRAKIEVFNADSSRLKRGIALTPVKFGISFTNTRLNQGGALIQVYEDGSVLVNHGGVEMGQGLITKVNQIVARVLGLPLHAVHSSATRTDKVPNASATAASASTDINGMAAFRAAQEIRDRLARVFAEKFDCPLANVVFADGKLRAGVIEEAFDTVCALAHGERVSLSAVGFYATPGINFDREQYFGQPFQYFAYGAAVTEVVLDTMTGEHRVLQVDLLHDVGTSINPAIDVGQIEGGYIQGLGWLTTEEVIYDDKGRLLARAPSTYKIPTAASRPAIFNTKLWPSSGNIAPTIFSSKAVGEPPFLLAASAFSAINAALASRTDFSDNMFIDAPATPECVLLKIQSRQRVA